MDVRLLGPVEATVDGREIPIGAGKPRALFAVLALHAGMPLSSDRLIEALWGERPPPTAAKLVQAHVSQLRKALDGNGALIATRGHAYQLDIDPESIDVRRFERLVDDGSPRDALSLWRGPPLSDVAAEPFAATEIRRLEELRLVAAERAIDADLAAGRHRETIGELDTLIGGQPLREKLHAQRMLALYRSGRQAEALEAFRTARAILVEQIGIEPGAELRALHDAILRQDPSLDLVAGEPIAAARTYTLLVGRVKEPGRRRESGSDSGAAGLGAIARSHGGIAAGTAGDGLAFAFRSAAQAVRCAVAVQEAAGTGSELSVGMHAGEARAGQETASRPAVLAARLAAFAGAGQVLVSVLVRELAGDDDELHFGEGRELTLPGLAGRMVVHDVRWGEARTRTLRVVIADDAALVRDGVAALLRDRGFEVVATVADATELHEAVARHLPDVALVDIRMPPTFTDEGLVAAARIRESFPDVGVLVLSQHLDARYALRVAEASPARTGYLLKDRVTDSHVLFEAVERIAAGGCVIDAAVATGLVARASALARIDELTEREREVLALVAEGCSNRAIAERLVVTQKTVETHIGQIFLKLRLRAVEGEDRRVAAVLAYLRAEQPS
jgi:DNA-binding NarL/FixJ family response regulator/DNA-binding SARP family transcriptional activator